MKLLGKALFGLFALVFVGLAGLWAVGAQEPSGPIYSKDRVLFVALNRLDLALDAKTAVFSDTALWRARARSVFVGEGGTRFTDFALFPLDADYQTEIEAAGPMADAYVAEVDLLGVPSLITGLLRTQFLLGVTRQPDGPLLSEFDEGLGRPDLLPTLESAERLLMLPADTQVTMVNFLEYFPTRSGDKEPGRLTYQRYGAQALRSVHAVGGQFLFAGKVSKVLVPSKASGAPKQWDDLAAMIYPDPEAIFYMEQFDYYKAALGYRDDALKSTRVVASVSY